MNDQKPPREWWIGISPIGVSHVCDTEKNAKAIGPKYTAVHVIEFSAYESLKAEVEISDERANGFYRRAWNAERQNAELRAELSKLQSSYSELLVAQTSPPDVEVANECLELRKEVAGLSENLAISNKAAVELEQEVESLRKRINENTK